MDNCIFCRIVAGDIPAAKLFEDEQTLAFLDIQPVNPGHALVIPKRHHDCLAATDDADLCALILTAKRLAHAVTAVVGTTDFNVVVNNGPVAGQVVPHTHIHVIPRFVGDGHEHWKKADVSAERMTEIAVATREKLK